MFVAVAIVVWALPRERPGGQIRSFRASARLRQKLHQRTYQSLAAGLEVAAPLGHRDMQVPVDLVSWH